MLKSTSCTLLGPMDGLWIIAVLTNFVLVGLLFASAMPIIDVWLVLSFNFGFALGSTPLWLTHRSEQAMVTYSMIILTIAMSIITVSWALWMVQMVQMHHVLNASVFSAITCTFIVFILLLHNREVDAPEAETGE